ncbi:MAG: delta-60 repeat domain-containing protein, partial [Ignavibacteriota bacterium]
MKFLVSVLLLLYISCLTYAQDGTLDISFGIGGKSKTDFNSFNDICRSIAQQSDGKILLAGYSNNGSNDDIAIIRYNYDGSLDNTFGNNGKVTTSIGNSYDRGFGVATQSDGKIVVTGYYSNGNDDDFFVVRYNNDGTLDTTFDHDGKVITDISLNNDRAVSVAIQSDEKIVVGGFAYNLGNFDFALVRYNSDGSLDLNFNSDGIVLTDIGSAENVGLSVVIQSDGKIILAGDSNFGNGYDFTIARYNSDGSLDNTFSEDGIVTTTIGPSDDYCYSIKVQNDEKIIAAGYTYNGSNYDFVIVRYNSDGSLDNEFDNDGIVTTIFGLNSADNAYGVAVQPDEKIVVAGYTYLQTDLDFAVARYHNNGSLDSSFNYNGKIVLADTLDNGAYSMLIQSDGKIVLGGFSNNGHDRDFAVVRLNNPSLPVELISFTGFIVNKNVNLNWITSTELNNMGFMIERSIDKISWATIGFREGKGTTSEPQ